MVGRGRVSGTFTHTHLCSIIIIVYVKIPPLSNLIKINLHKWHVCRTRNFPPDRLQAFLGSTLLVVFVILPIPVQGEDGWYIYPCMPAPVISMQTSTSVYSSYHRRGCCLCRLEIPIHSGDSNSRHEALALQCLLLSSFTIQAPAELFITLRCRNPYVTISSSAGAYPHDECDFNSLYGMRLR